MSELTRNGEGWSYKGLTSEIFKDENGVHYGEAIRNERGQYFGEDGTWGEDYRARLWQDAKGVRRALMMVGDTGKFVGSYFG